MCTWKPGTCSLEGILQEAILGLQHPFLLSQIASSDSDSTMERGTVLEYGLLPPPVPLEHVLAQPKPSQLKVMQQASPSEEWKT